LASSSDPSVRADAKSKTVLVHGLDTHVDQMTRQNFGRAYADLVQSVGLANVSLSHKMQAAAGTKHKSRHTQGHDMLLSKHASAGNTPAAATATAARTAVRMTTRHLRSKEEQLVPASLGDSPCPCGDSVAPTEAKAQTMPFNKSRSSSTEQTDLPVHQSSPAILFAPRRGIGEQTCYTRTNPPSISCSLEDSSFTSLSWASCDTLSSVLCANWEIFTVRATVTSKPAIMSRL